jgi:DNA-binding winged helix-turn-helix (wHTH) protein/Tol biopolymer transport system component
MGERPPIPPASAPGSASNGRVHFGVFEVDLGSGELRKSGLKIKLHGQPFEVLVMLLERPGEVVTREELQQKLWASDTIVDFEQGLNKAINKLREALGDFAETPRYIETLPRRGYRFVCPLTQVSPVQVRITEENEKEPPPTTNRRKSRTAVPMLVGVFAAAGTVLLVVTFAVFHFFASSRFSNRPAKIMRVSHWNKPMSGTILSPDGHIFAFVSPVGGVNQVFVMLASGGEPLQLTNDAGDKMVDSFSLDGTQLYYEYQWSGGEVLSVPALGGAPTHLISGSGLITSPADGSFFYYKPGNDTVVRKPASGVAEELVMDLGAQEMIPWGMLVFPDGKDLLVVASPASQILSIPPTITLYKVNVASRDWQKLGELSGSPTGFAWRRPGESLLFSRTVDDVTNLWEYSLRDAGLKQVTYGAGPDSSPIPAPSGNGIYYVTGRESEPLTVYNTRSKQSFYPVTGNATQPLLSWDGRHVSYITLAGDQRQELWISDIDGKNKVKLTSSVSLGALTFSSDSSQFLFGDVVGDEERLYLVNSDGSGLRQIPWSGADVGWATWSPDARILYFSGYEKGAAKLGTWKVASDSAKVEKITENCGYAQDISVDGRHLLSGNGPGGGKGIYDFSLADGKCAPLLPDLATLVIHFSPDAKSVLYLSALRGETVIYRQPWNDGKLTGPAQPAMRIPFSFPQGYFGNAYDFSKDLSTLVYVRPGGQADLYFLGDEQISK